MNLDENEIFEIICNFNNEIITFYFKCNTKFIEIKKKLSNNLNIPIKYIFLYSPNNSSFLDNDIIIKDELIIVKIENNKNIDENYNLQTLIEENKEKNEYKFINKKKNRENYLKIDENGKLKSNFDPKLEDLENLFNICFNQNGNNFDINKFNKNSGQNIYNFEEFFDIYDELVQYEKNKNKKKNYFKKKINLKRHDLKNNNNKQELNIKNDKRELNKNIINKEENKNNFKEKNNVENETKQYENLLIKKNEQIKENNEKNENIENINIVFDTDNKTILNENIKIDKTYFYIKNSKINNFSIEKINNFAINQNNKNIRNNNNEITLKESENSSNKNNSIKKLNNSIENNFNFENNNNYCESNDDFFLLEENRHKHSEKNNKEKIEKIIILNDNNNLIDNIQKNIRENNEIKMFFKSLIDKKYLDKNDIKKLKYNINFFNVKISNDINKKNKINFIFDVDNTLIHCVPYNFAGYKHIKIINELSKNRDILIFSFEIRKYVIEFIKNISKFCKIHINSLGKSKYISLIVNELKKDYDINFETITSNNDIKRKCSKNLNNFSKNNSIVIDDLIEVWENDIKNVISSKAFFIKNYNKNIKKNYIFFNFLNDKDWKYDNMIKYENNEIMQILSKEFSDSKELQLKYLEKNVEIIYKLYNCYNIPTFYSIKLIRLCIFGGFCFNIEFLDNSIQKDLIIKIIKTCGGDYYDCFKNNYKVITHIIYNDIIINQNYEEEKYKMGQIKKKIKYFVDGFERKIKIVNLRYIFDSYYFMTNLIEDNILYKVDI